MKVTVQLVPLMFRQVTRIGSTSKSETNYVETSKNFVLNFKLHELDHLGFAPSSMLVNGDWMSPAHFFGRLFACLTLIWRTVFSSMILRWVLLRSFFECTIILIGWLDIAGCLLSDSSRIIVHDDQNFYRQLEIGSFRRPLLVRFQKPLAFCDFSDQD